MRQIVLGILVLALVGCASTPVTESQTVTESAEPVLHKATFEEARSETGEILAFRLTLEEGGVGVCGEKNLPDSAFTKVGSAVGTDDVPIYAKNNDLNCSIIVEKRDIGLVIEVSQPAAPNPFG